MKTTSLDTIILPTTTIGSFSTGGNNLSQFVKGSYQIVWDYTTGDSAGNVTLQASDDGINYVNYPGAAIPFTSGSTSDVYEFTSVGFKWARLNFDVTSGSAGTVTVYGHFLRDN